MRRNFFDYYFYPASYEYDRYKLSAEGHFNYPGLNQVSSKVTPDHNDIFSKPKFAYKLSDHYVIDTGKEPLDYSKYLSNNKKNWMALLRNYNKKIGKIFQKDILNFKKCKDFKNISPELIQYFQFLDTDPAPAILNERNWLFRGGTIAVLNQIDGNITFLACGGENLSLIQRFEVSEDIRLLDKCSYDLKMKEPVLQVVSNGDPLSTIVGVRQQHHVTIFSANGSSLMQLKRKYATSREFISSLAIYGNTMALLKNHGTIALYDVEEKKTTYKKLWRNDLDHAWNNIFLWKDGVWVTKGKTIYNLDNKDDCTNWDITELRQCEAIRHLFRSDGETNSLFALSEHHLLEIDVRMRKCLRKWTHMISRNADMGQAVRMDNGEDFILLQSANAYEAVAIINTPESTLFFPRVLSSPPDTFRKAKLELVCLDPAVKNRPCFSIIGSILVKGKKDLLQITQNGGGDIFMRKIKKNEANKDAAAADDSDDDCDDNECDSTQQEKVWMTWEEYEKNCLKHPNVAPVFTSIVDVNGLLQNLKSMGEEQIEDPLDFIYDPGNEDSVCWNGMNVTNPDSLHEYVDYLGKRVVEIWMPNVETEEEGSEIDDNETNDNGKSKVEEWFSRMDGM